MNRRIVVFLQNAWSPFYAGRVWPRESWLRALKGSRTGQRLSVMIDDLDLCEETTPEVTAEPNGIAPPDFDHIREVLKRRRPEIVVTCGAQAEKALARVWEGHTLILPHPAYRVVTNALFLRARQILGSHTLTFPKGYASREFIKLVQSRGQVSEERWSK